MPNFDCAWVMGIVLVPSSVSMSVHLNVTSHSSVGPPGVLSTQPKERLVNECDVTERES